MSKSFYRRFHRPDFEEGNITCEDVDKNKPTDVGINVGTNVGINITQQKILSEIMNNPKVKVNEMAGRLGLKSRTIERAIRALKGKGILEREGSNKTGYWKVKE